MSNEIKPEHQLSANDRSNARLGIRMFIIYCAVYAGFVGICAFSLGTMQRQVLGVNLAIFYGVALIGFAFVLALIYMWLCRTDDNRKA